MSLKTVQDQLFKVALKAGRDPQEITLLVVSKKHSVEEIAQLYSQGARDFGETRVQEALPKIEELPKDIRWHFIGTVQKNKISKIVGNFVLIHSVDSLEVADKISQTSLQRGVVTNVLLEANTSGEKSKAGLTPSAWKGCFTDLLELKGIQVQGLMTMAPLTEDRECIRETFRQLRLLREDLRAELPILSMGMSGDFPLAIEEGATIVRIGRAIFAP